MNNQVSALATYAGQLVLDTEEVPRWAMMDVDLGGQENHLCMPAFIQDLNMIQDISKYFNDYNIRRKIWIEGSMEEYAGNVFLYIRKLLLLEKFYTLEELQRYRRGKVDFSKE